MRIAVGLIAVLCLTTLAQAQESTPAPAEQAKAATPAATAPTPQTTITASKELTPAEKDLLRHGYRLEVRNGERRFCRQEDTLGSRLHAHKVCGSVESLTRRAEINRDQVRDNLQNTVINRDPSGH
jgi:hypothetical protein